MRWVFGVAAIQNNLELWQQGCFDKIKSVAEIGSQEIHVTAEDFEILMTQANVPNYDISAFPGLENWPSKPRCPAKYFYRMLGVTDYSCLDLNEEHGAVKHDMNLPLHDESLVGQFDLVTDHGACEHVFNVTEAYRTLHKLCKPGGYIIIAQNVWGGNGYFLYDQSFVEGIVAANGYQVIYDGYVVSLFSETENGSESQYHIPLSRELLKVIDVNSVRGIGIYVVLKKKNEENEFQIPYQGRYLSEKQQHSGFRRLFYRDPFRFSYIPEYTEARADKILLKTLVSEVGRRLRRKCSW